MMEYILGTGLALLIGTMSYLYYYRYTDNVTELFTYDYNNVRCIKYHYRGKKYIYLTSKDDTILDFGCGSGELINFFKEKNFKKIFGYDVTENLINPNLKSIVITDLSANFRGLDKINFNIVFFNGVIA